MGLIEPGLMCSVHDVNWLVSFFQKLLYSRRAIVVQQLGEKVAVCSEAPTLALNLTNSH